MKTSTLLVLLAFALPGCSKKEDVMAQPPSPSAGASSTPASATSLTTASAGDVTSEEDFEDEAEAQIDDSNLEAEVAKMEKEIP